VDGLVAFRRGVPIGPKDAVGDGRLLGGVAAAESSVAGLLADGWGRKGRTCCGPANFTRLARGACARRHPHDRAAAAAGTALGGPHADVAPAGDRPQPTAHTSGEEFRRPSRTIEARASATVCLAVRRSCLQCDVEFDSASLDTG
jgi:hypothetical protein